MNGDFIAQLAEMRREIAALKRQRVTYRSGTVTAVDAVASTFTADVAGAGSLSGVPAEPAFLPAVGDTVRLSLAGATPIYQPHRIGEGTVGYTELDGQVGGAIDDAVQNASVALTAANGKNAVIFSPNPAPGSGVSGTRAGDIWWQRNSAGVLIGTWEWDGDSWNPHTFGDAVFDTVSVGKLTSGQIAAGVDITIGDPNGDYTLIDAQKLAFLAADPDGDPDEIARFGRQQGGRDPATGEQTWAITELGEASFQTIAVTGEAVFQGVPLSQRLLEGVTFSAGASRGSQTDPAGTPSGGGETGYYEFTAELEPDHLYELKSSNLWVRPEETTTTRIDVNLHYTCTGDPAADPPAVTVASPLFTRAVNHVDGSSSNLGHSVTFSRLMRYDVYTQWRFLLSLGSSGGSAYFEMGSENHTNDVTGTVIEPDVVQFWLVDYGPIAWTNRAISNGGSTGSPAPAPAPVKRYTFTYYPLWTRRFRGDGSVHTDGGSAVQGYYPLNGDQKSQIGDYRRAGNVGLVADLQGATIEKFEIYLYASHWYYNSGGTALIRYHNNVGPTGWANVAGLITVGGWGRSQGRWVNATSWGNIFRDGGAKGIAVGPSGGTDPIYYGTFDGHTGAHPPAIRVTYTK